MSRTGQISRIATADQVLPPRVLMRRLGMLLLSAILAALDRGFVQPIVGPVWIHSLQILCMGMYMVDFWILLPPTRLGMLATKQFLSVARMLHSLLVISAILGTMQYNEAWVLFDLLVVLMLSINLWWLNMLISRLLAKPELLLPMGFVLIIAIGTVLLKLPLATVSGPPLSWTDSLFTITSAVCVTGLIVRDTATDFTPFGQAIIGIFILLGGLGIMIFGTVFAMLLGARTSLRDEITLSRVLNDQPLQNVVQLTQFILLSTMVCILIGTVAMIPLWQESLSLTERVGYSLFHSVSAFCNAGFALKSDSLVAYRYSMLSHMVIVPLLVIGGIGFPVISNLYSRVRHKTRLTLHTKTVLTTTAVLYVGGTILLFAAQLTHHAYDAAGLNVTANARHQAITVSELGGKLADASFLSWSSRTAGFNTIDMTNLSSGEYFITMLLMMAGGSPSGTAGGMRTTTVALIFVGLLATLRQKNEATAFGRRLDESLIRKAAAMAACYIGLVSIATFLMCLSEPFPFMRILFEVISAATCTGLSAGITGELTTFGKYVIIGTMFLGRLGPMGLMVILFFKTVQGPRFRYAREDVLLG
jgi:trk system potassium uptake protein TrkH